jgi:hypothetical protein
MPSHHTVDCSPGTVQCFVAVSAQGNEVQIVVVALLAPVLLVVDMQILPGTADLASPAIAGQNLLSELVVRFGIKPQARTLGSNLLHEAFPVTSCRKACRCSPGRNLKNRDIDCSSTVGSSLIEVLLPASQGQIGEWEVGIGGVYVSEGAMTFRRCSILNRLPFQPSATMYRAERLEGVSRCPIPGKPPSSRNRNNPKRTPGPTHTGRNTTFLEEYSKSPASLGG